MSVALQYAGEVEFNNTKGILFKGTLSGNYGAAQAAGVGDLLNLTPSQNNGADGGVTDPNFTYDEILEQPPGSIGILNAPLGGSYCAIQPNAAPSLNNFGLVVYEPGGTEKAAGAAYTTAEKAGFVLIIAFIPKYN